MDTVPELRLVEGNKKSRSLHWTPLETIRIAGQDLVVASRAELAATWAADCLARRDLGRSCRPRLLFDANGHGVSLFESDPRYRNAAVEADLIHADGGFLVLVSRLMGTRPIAERSATTDLFHDFASVAETHGLTFYLLGGTESVNRQCSETLKRLYPRLQIVGRRNGYFTPDEEAGLVEEIASLNPDVLWVGLGKPKEQQFAADWKHRLRAGWLVTCGGCYNYVTGHYPRAPLWMQRWCLEWLHRAASNPRRLLWRYLTTSPHALWVALRSFLTPNASR